MTFSLEKSCGVLSIQLTLALYLILIISCNLENVSACHGVYKQFKKTPWQQVRRDFVAALK